MHRSTSAFKMSGEPRSLKTSPAKLAYAKAYREKNSTLIKQRRAQWVEDHREHKREYERKRRRDNKAYFKVVDRRRRLGFDPPRPEPMHCELCGGTNTRAMCADHDHQTGVFRGWLCDPCNRGLGFLRENPVVLARAADWVRFGGPT